MSAPPHPHDGPGPEHLLFAVGGGGGVRGVGGGGMVGALLAHSYCFLLRGESSTCVTAPVSTAGGVHANPGVCKEYLNIGSLALPFPTQSRHCPLLAAPGRNGAAPGRGCHFSILPVTQGRSQFSPSDCDAHLPTGSITFSNVHFSREQTFLSYFILFRTCPGKRGSIWAAPLNPKL